MTLWRIRDTVTLAQENGRRAESDSRSWHSLLPKLPIPIDTRIRIRMQSQGPPRSEAEWRKRPRTVPRERQSPYYFGLNRIWPARSRSERHALRDLA